ncbi:TonB-dependent receptor [Saccharicrinis aurantiacus]|uniref:TonB-dependent receptor n=1 Tax=Saccharicrinis aurantiacus TaxID=1849719 RepID=UPI00094FAC8C|nr:TonB-dependent receptor plug domain-containing protein [Saccharicrinis aurantiacus]
MYIKLGICLVIIGLYSFQLFGQDTFSEEESLFLAGLDTVYIDNVDVVSKKINLYEVGGKKETFTPMQKQTTEAGNLSDLISRYQPIYVKSDAGGLSSIRVRGTSDNHTSVKLRGLEINSQTLGSYNSSNAPVFLFDQVELTYGSSTATKGSGSIGGNVNLGLENKYNAGVNSEVKLSAGSFGEYMAGAKVFASNGKFESISRLAYYEKENNFPFTNTSSYDFEKQEFTRDTQKNARIENLNFIQQLNYRWNKDKSISSVIWLAKNRHEGQPNMNENQNPNTRYLEDENIRTWVQFDNITNGINYYIGAGYVFDNAIDYNNKAQKIATQRIIAETGASKEYNKISVKAGMRNVYIKPDVYAYDDNIDENRFSVFASLLYKPSPWLKTTLNLRQQVVTEFSAPFTPSLGFDARLWYNSQSIISVLGSLQRAYRIPTLNDRFWGQDGYTGNKNISPEDATSYELGFNYLYALDDKWVANAKINAFYMDVDNWLMWIQGTNGWYAENIAHVISNGVEFSGSLTRNYGQHKTTLGGNFSYNSAERKKSELETDKLNEQIEYVPIYNGNLYMQHQYKKWDVGIDGSYVGERKYNQVGGKLDAFKLINLSCAYNMNINKNKLTISANINNLLSEEYQNQYNYAMPEINYRIGINYTF